MRQTRSRGLGLGLALATLALLSPASPDAATGPNCDGRPATIVDLGGDAHLRGTGKADVILTGAGDDVVDGGGGNDHICSGAGNDRIEGGIGADTIESGGGDDEIEGGNGSDRVEAGGGRDTVFGNRGNDSASGGPGAGDFVDGGLGDDTVEGGSGGFDQVIGDVGNDKVLGGPGDGDVLRGDHGSDLLDGGPGAHDAASFATSGENGNIVGGRGVEVDLAAGDGAGDGSDRLAGIEDVVGTPFRDRIFGSTAVNDLYGAGGKDDLRANGSEDRAFGGPGPDVCTGFTAVDSCGTEPGVIEQRFEVDLAGGPASTTLNAVYRNIEEFLPNLLLTGPVLIVPMHIAVSFEAGAWVVREDPLPLLTGDRCQATGPGEARCPISGRPDSVYVDGGKGDDLIEVTESVPDTVSALLQGSYGNDTLLGGEGDDSLDGGPTEGRGRADVLEGRGGDDALTLGALLDGGPGSDLLIIGPCSGEQAIGGGGIDSASFARAAGFGVEAQIGGTATVAPRETKHGTVPGGCGPYITTPPSAIDDSVERIEGSPNDDILIGDGGPNTILGRGGDDELRGGGGEDILVGGSGHDALAGDGGFDRLYARDSHRDESLSCGGGNLAGVVLADPGDPPAAGCREGK